MKQLYFLFFLIFPGVLLAQQVPQFMRFYGANYSDWATNLAYTNDGGYLLGVSTPNNPPVNSEVSVGIVKTDLHGNEQWIQEFMIGNYTLIRKVIAVQNGYIAVVATGNLFLGPTHPVLVKMDWFGNILWARAYEIDGNEVAVDLIEAENGDLILLSQTQYNVNIERLWLLRLNAGGGVIWSRVWATTGEFYTGKIKETETKRLVVAGAVSSMTGNHGMVSFFDSTGTYQKGLRFSTGFVDEIYGLFVNSVEEVFACGQSYFINRNFDAMVCKIDSSASPVSFTFYDAGTPQGEVARDIVPSGGRMAITGDVGGFDDRDIFLSEINVNGSIEWVQKYPISPAFTNYAFSLIKTSDGGFAWTGDVRPQSFQRDAPLVKTDSKGRVGCFEEPASFEIYHDPVDSLPMYWGEVIHQVTAQPVVVNVLVTDFSQKTFCEFIPPVANYTVESMDTICPLVCVNFTDTSLYQVNQWEWYFEEGFPDTSTAENPTGICFPGTGTYAVTLIVHNPFTSDTLESEVYIPSLCPLVIPNIFSPNGDGINDMFQLLGLPVNFQLDIYNRWGNIVYRTSNPLSMWNGAVQNTGNPSPEGVYYYVLQNTDTGTISNGYFQLVRE